MLRSVQSVLQLRRTPRSQKRLHKCTWTTPTLILTPLLAQRTPSHVSIHVYPNPIRHNIASIQSVRPIERRTPVSQLQQIIETVASLAASAAPTIARRPTAGAFRRRRPTETWFSFKRAGRLQEGADASVDVSWPPSANNVRCLFSECDDWQVYLLYVTINWSNR